jgi:CRISPR-associated endonuclease Csn1
MDKDTAHHPHDPRRYRVGIDVGSYSVGLAAIEVDETDRPISVLNMESIIHDAGVDPTANKTAGTRRAVSGTARRMRRLYRRRRQRLRDLDKVLVSLGLPIIDLEQIRDPRFPWKVRAALVGAPVDDRDKLLQMLSVAVRHMARHRGWRSPYAKIPSLLEQPPSKYFVNLVDAIAQRPGAGHVTEAMTVAEIVVEALRSDLGTQLRGDGGLLESKIHQSDNVRELRRIWDTQQLPEPWFRQVVDAVFQAKSPKGSAVERVGKDPLPGAHGRPRAPKASLAFQRFRIVSIVANLRIGDRPLTPAERKTAVDFLWTASGKSVTWQDVADAIGVTRHDLRGTADATADGERAGARPPVNVTDERIRQSKIKPLVEYWDDHDPKEREALIQIISNGSAFGADEDAAARAEEFVSCLPEEVQGKLDDIKLPEGRAAYSLASLRRLTGRMESSEDDLYQARVHEFHVEPTWQPPADPIGQPVGNPAVDRVLKIVARWLSAAEDTWGAPAVVNIESTRQGLTSEAQRRKTDRVNNQRADQRQRDKEDLAAWLADGSADGGMAQDELPTSVGQFRRSDVVRYQAMRRQDCKCLYCGQPLTFGTFEMDHIVPRAGQGSTNTQTNLAAVCGPCNRSKGKVPFKAWAESPAGQARGVTVAGAVERATQFFGTGSKNKEEREFIDKVVSRLKRTDADEPDDNRSIEAVGWMASELRHRVEAHYIKRDIGTKVGLFRGWLTSEARKASGVQDRFLLVGGNPGKDRIDRRHHALDAATIAMMRPGIAQALVVRDNLRNAQHITGGAAEGDTPWKEYRGENATLFNEWTEHMDSLVWLVQQQLDQDRVPVFEFLRLRLGSSQGHEDSIRSFKDTVLKSGTVLKAHARVGDELPVELIDRSATPAQWVALTRASGFEPGVGLPADPDRRIRIHDRWFGPDDELSFFPTTAGCIALRGGYAELGSSFHHARIYRCTQVLKSGKEKVFYAMMRVYQVDLLGHKHEDLFHVEIPPQTISRRAAEKRLREAMDAGHATYVGWLVPGDELLLNMSEQSTGQVALFRDTFPEGANNRWVVAGFFSPTVLRMRPRGLAGEGIGDDAPKDLADIIAGRGWLPSVNVIFGQCSPAVLRRDVLGRPRTASSVGLPVCWQVNPGQVNVNGELASS